MNTKFLSVYSFVGGALSLLMFAGCGNNERQVHSRGFHLPEGDAELGKSLFVQFDCTRCHRVSGVDFPASDESVPKIEIGGEVNRISSYGELVTSIMSPQHVISPKYLALLSEEERKEGTTPSPMPVFNEELTVKQLIDLASFLHSRYSLIEPTVDDFDYFYD